MKDIKTEMKLNGNHYMYGNGKVEETRTARQNKRKQGATTFPAPSQINRGDVPPSQHNQEFQMPHNCSDANPINQDVLDFNYRVGNFYRDLNIE